MSNIEIINAFEIVSNSNANVDMFNGLLQVDDIVSLGFYASGQPFEKMNVKVTKVNLDGTYEGVLWSTPIFLKLSNDVKFIRENIYRVFRENRKSNSFPSYSCLFDIQE